MRLPFEKETSRAAFSDILNGTVRSLHLHGVVHMAKNNFRRMMESLKDQTKLDDLWIRLRRR